MEHALLLKALSARVQHGDINPTSEDASQTMVLRTTSAGLLVRRACAQRTEVFAGRAFGTCSSASLGQSKSETQHGDSQKFGGKAHEVWQVFLNSRDVVSSVGSRLSSLHSLTSTTPLQTEPPSDPFGCTVFRSVSRRRGSIVLRSMPSRG